MRPRAREAILTLLFLTAGILLSLRAGSNGSGAASPARSFETILRGKIEPAAQVNSVAEYAARVVKVHVASGAHVKAGDLLITLENDEITSQVTAAQKRIEIVKGRLSEVRDRDRIEQSRAVDQERGSAALRDRDAAKERLDGVSPDGAERELAAARARSAELGNLARQGLATTAEVDSARAREIVAERSAESAREHLSRLRQELADAESQVRLTQLRPAAAVSDRAAAEADLADALNVLDLAVQRASRLKVTAAVSGTVIDVVAREGDSVLAGSVVARVADLSRIALSVPVTAAIARAVRPGTPVEVRLPTDPPRPMRAAIDSVTLAPDGAQHAYLIRIVAPNPAQETLLVGLEAEIEFSHSKRL
jgi:multidrug efflux pump subunit AcrA (membrane-fusion protein)